MNTDDYKECLERIRNFIIKELEYDSMKTEAGYPAMSNDEYNAILDLADLIVDMGRRK